VTMTFKCDFEIVKVNQHAKYRGSKSYRSSSYCLDAQTDRQTDTHTHIYISDQVLYQYCTLSQILIAHKD